MVARGVAWSVDGVTGFIGVYGVWEDGPSVGHGRLVAQVAHWGWRVGLVYLHDPQNPTVEVR
jgi:hypothetical protein